MMPINIERRWIYFRFKEKLLVGPWLHLTALSVDSSELNCLWCIPWKWTSHLFGRMTMHFGCSLHPAVCRLATTSEPISIFFGFIGFGLGLGSGLVVAFDAMVFIVHFWSMHFSWAISALPLCMYYVCMCSYLAYRMHCLSICCFLSGPHIYRSAFVQCLNHKQKASFIVKITFVMDALNLIRRLITK